MNGCKRAILYIVRKWKKSVLIFSILFVISALTLTGLAVLDAQEEKSAELRGATGSNFTVSRNLATGNWAAGEGGSYNTQELVTSALIDKIAKMEGIKNYDAASVSILNFFDPDGNFYKGLNPTGYDFADSQFYTIGTLNSEYSSLFLSKTFALVEGRHITTDDKNAILISKKIAEKYHLSIGDTVGADTKAKSPMWHYKIVGIFEVLTDKTDEKNNYDMQSYYDFDSYAFLDMKGLEDTYYEYPEEGPQSGFEAADFFVSDPTQLESMIHNVQNIKGVDWNNFKITANNEVFERTSNSMSNVSKLIVSLIVMAVAISTAAIIFILSMWMKSRKKEIGILLSIGVSKTGILLQYLFEVIVIGAAAFLLSYLLSSLIAKSIGTLLEKSPETIAVTFKHFTTVVGFGAVILVIAVLVSCLPIMRFKPKEILSQTE